MPAAIDVTGQRFNRLVVLRPEGRRGRDKMWLCQCDCGNLIRASAGALRSGNPQSCGCRQREFARRLCISKTTHGMSNKRLYNIWHTMNQRCYYDKHIGWKFYGGRGITVCNEWKRFEPFMEWSLSNGYDSHLTIDRIDSDGDYEPSNCRWVTHKVQQNNRRSNTMLTHGGRTQTLTQWADELGIGCTTLHYRLAAGYASDDILSTQKNKYTRSRRP